MYESDSRGVIELISNLQQLFGRTKRVVLRPCTNAVIHLCLCEIHEVL